MQKKILKEEDNSKEDSLIKEDKKLEELANNIIMKCLKLTKKNEKDLEESESKI